MNAIPETGLLDSTLHFIKDPYRFVKAQSRLLRSDIFQTRLLFEKTICMTGSEAARIFVNEEIFCRKGATPEFIRATLFGKGGIQGLDDEAHLHRKKLFMSFMTPENVERLNHIFLNWLDIYSAKWSLDKNIVLYDELHEVLTRSVCEWAGVHLKEEEVVERTKELASMFDAAGSAKRHLEARTARIKAENWIRGIVKDERGNGSSNSESVVSAIAHFKDLNGDHLSAHVAAVEILNILRPTVAVSAYLIFCTHALIMNPLLKERIRYTEAGFMENFVSEVRRFYPFFPALIAKTRKNFSWNGFDFQKNTRVILDLYGTNHDSRYWSVPSQFNPDRFKKSDKNPFTFTPQGVGDHLLHHRCPGEFITIKLMKSFSEYLVTRIDFTVPSQDLSLDMTRLPALPKSHLILTKIKRSQFFLDVTA